jgi:hypothetical protein
VSAPFSLLRTFAHAPSHGPVQPNSVDLQEYRATPLSSQIPQVRAEGAYRNRTGGGPAWFSRAKDLPLRGPFHGSCAPRQRPLAALRQTATAPSLGRPVAAAKGTLRARPRGDDCRRGPALRFPVGRRNLYQQAGERQSGSPIHGRRMTARSRTPRHQARPRL